jgi:MarR family transcriptional regulator, organic hydroperoxide resistance regulator
MRKARQGARGALDASGNELSFDRSIGYQIRATHRALQRYLQIQIEPFDIAPGVWYFLRALWHEDGLTQRELSDRIGTSEPTTLIALKSMETQGLVKRVRNKEDRRKLHIWLTPKAKRLKVRLIPLARHVVGTAADNLSMAEVDKLLALLARVQTNLKAAIDHSKNGDGARGAKRTPKQRATIHRRAPGRRHG